MLELKKKNNRFEIENVGCKDSVTTYILTDKDTGVQYLYVWGGVSGSVTPLLGNDLKVSVKDSK